MTSAIRCSAILAVLLVSTGCVGAGGDDASIAPQTAPSVEAGQDSGAETGADPPAPPARVVTREGDGYTTAAVRAAPAQTVFAENARLELPEAGGRRGTVVATWTARTPASATLHIELERDGERIPEAVGEGASPLTIELSTKALAKRATLLARAYPVSPGAVIDQQIHYVLTAEYA